MSGQDQAFPARTVEAFSDVLAARNYTPIPDSAWIAVTDVVGSTQAISLGRYKDVNLAGAAGIAAFFNAFPSLEPPFAFGGDGAVILVPDGAQGRAAQVLASLQGAAQSTLGLSLRTSLVPVSLVRKSGKDVRIVYRQMLAGRRLPMLCGGGIALAEELAKSDEGAPFRIMSDPNAAPPDLDGLSCRWQPIKPKRGVALSVLIQGPSEPDAYLPIFDALAVAAAGPLSPLDSPPTPIWPPARALREARLADGKVRLRRMAAILSQSALGALSTFTGIPIGGFDGRYYRDSLLRHCDALKFADGLKMVLDCTRAQADAVDAALEALPPNPAFAYGVQRSDSALMTCFVQSPSDAGHVHFIDGAQGGYALAAQSLKNRPARLTFS